MNEVTLYLGVRRYNASNATIWNPTPIEEHEYGDYVKHGDYAKLEAETVRLREKVKEIQGLREHAEQFCDWFCELNKILVADMERAIKEHHKKALEVLKNK